jgi:hypothetical protein
MDFEFSPQAEALCRQLRNFMDDHVIPRIGAWNEAEAAWRARKGCGICFCPVWPTMSRAGA